MTDGCTRVAHMAEESVRTLLSLGLDGDDECDFDSSLRQLTESLKTSRLLTEAVVADLKTGVCTIGAGPLAIDRMTGLSPNELQPLAGRTFLDALTSVDVPDKCLGALAQFGELLMNDVFPELTRTSGAAIYCLAMSAIQSRSNVKRTSQRDQAICTTLSALVDCSELPASASSMLVSTIPFQAKISDSP